MLDKTKKVVVELYRGRERVLSVVSEREAKEYLEFRTSVGLKREISIKDITDIVKSDNLCEQVEELMSAAGYYDVYPDNGYIAIELTWGDWKHDHAFVNSMMHEAFGLQMAKETITEQDGDDAYSSIHYYKIL